MGNFRLETWDGWMGAWMMDGWVSVGSYGYIYTVDIKSFDILHRHIYIYIGNQGLLCKLESQI